MLDLVCKFGGSSLANAQRIKNVAEIVKSGGEKFVILSAPGKRDDNDTKITDCLISMWNNATLGLPYKKEMSFLKRRFTEIKKGLNVSINLTPLFSEIKSELDGPLDYDYIISRGEYLMARIFAEYSCYEFLDSKDFIIFGKEGKVDMYQSKLRFDRLVLANKKYVIPGFYGAMENGRIKTFSRGGSDITGAICSALSSAKVYENFTDVDGFLDADPKICKEASLIPKLSYGELRELSYTGASVLHPDCVKFLKENDIILNLKNTFKPTCKGSLIMPDNMTKHSHITGISGQKGFVIFNISKFGMHKDSQSYNRIFSLFAEQNVSIEHIHSGIDNVSIIVPKMALRDKAINTLIASLKENFEEACVIENVCIISIVGLGLLKNKRLEKKVLNAIYDTQKRVLTLNKGGEGLSIILSVEEDDYADMINDLHSTLLKK